MPTRRTMQMKTCRLFLIAAVLLFGISAAYAEFVPLRADVQGERPQISILRHDAKQVQIEVRLPGLDLFEGTLEGRNWDRIAIPGGGYHTELGRPEIPHFTRMLAIPERSGVRVELQALEMTTLTDIDLMPVQEYEPEELTQKGKASRIDAVLYDENRLYPEWEAASGTPAIMRGLRVVPIQMNPVRYNPATRELHIVHRFQVTVHFEGTDQRNVPQRPMRPISRSWKKLMDDQVMNLDELDLDEVEMGSYLIICEDDSNLVTNILPRLIDWKRRKGHTVVVETFTPSSSSSTIKNIIQNAYNTWTVPPEYVLLFGDSSGSYSLSGWYPDDIDHPYAQLDGGDILADVAIGRLPAYDDYEATVMVNKVLFYEKMPYTASSDWYHQACLVAGSSSSGSSTVQTNRWIKTRLIWNEYTRIDTFWYWMGGSASTTMTNSINNGITYLNYRGWLGMSGFGTSSINALTNGRKLPFVTTLTCDTGGFSGNSVMEAFVSVGTPTTPKGAIGCVGTATWGTHTRFNNTVDMGIYAGIFDEGITQAGNALNRGKLELYNAYHLNDPGNVESFSKWNALAGDPGLELFTGAIKYLECAIPSTVSWGENSVTLTVNETGVGPLEDAAVCFYMDGDIHDVRMTDAAGQVTMPLDVAGAGNVKVTITKQNFYPIVDSLDVVQADVAVGYFDHSIDDDNTGSSSGDSDGVINPGETVEIPLVFKNYGSSTTATGVSVTVTESDEYATLDDDYETFPNIGAGATANSADDLDLTVSNNCPHGHIVQLALDTQTDQGSWDGLLELEVVSYDMLIRSAYATGGDTLLSPGETSDFVLEIRNIGGKWGPSLSATITSLDTNVTVNDNYAYFGTVAVGATTTCSPNPFNLTAGENAPPGHMADLEVVFASSSGATQTEVISIALGTKSMSDPQGPDEYGYYCFDNTDAFYPKAPAYDWVEIDPAYGGSGTQLPIYDSGENQDASANIPLPFTFRYYGEDVDEITVCSNGWISTWANNSFTDFRNYPIPSPIGPNGMIAAFWDDLITGSGGYVFAKDDANEHRFIIQWSRMRTLGSPQPQETFEIILYDPAYYTIPNGDGEILFQYYSITEVSGYYDDNPYSTVGIESPNQEDGIQVVYWNTYTDPAAAHVQNNRAYLFTTDFEYDPSITPQMIIELTYVSGSPIPLGGGTLYYEIFGENQGPVALNLDGWIDIVYEGGPPRTIIQRALVNYQPGWQINRPDVFFPVPASYAAGNYEMIGRVGIYPDDIWDESSFPWAKSGDNVDKSFVPWVPAGVPDPFEIITKPETEIVIPEEYAVLGNYPNPFNPVTTIRFALPDAGKVSLSIYSVNGSLVATLVDGQRTAGVHDVTFDASDLASGIYFYRLTVGQFVDVGKMILMK